MRAAILLLVVVAVGCGMPPIPVGKDSPRYDFEAGRVAFEAKRYLDAQTHLKRFLDLNPGHSVADSAQLLLGKAQASSGSFAEAAVEFAILVREFPRSELRDDAAFEECSAYFAQMRPAQLDPTFSLRARGCFNEFLLRFPDSPLGEDARTRLVDIANRLAEKEYEMAEVWMRLKRYESVLVYTEEILGKYRSSTWVPKAMLLHARALERLGRYEESKETLRRLLAGFPEDEMARDARRLLNALRAQDGEPPVPESDSGGETEQ